MSWKSLSVPHERKAHVHSDVFDNTLGHTDVITHKIETGNAAPIRQYPWRLPYAYRHETSTQICDMLQQKLIQYLGHVVSGEGIHTDPDKINAVASLQDPKNVEKVRLFLGLAGYYRKFIPNFATIPAPLVNLTKKNTKFLWRDDHHEAFVKLKNLLCEAPILAYPQFDKRFILQTDASD